MLQHISKYTKFLAIDGDFLSAMEDVMGCKVDEEKINVNQTCKSGEDVIKVD